MVVAEGVGATGAVEAGVVVVAVGDSQAPMLHHLVAVVDGKADARFGVSLCLEPSSAMDFSPAFGCTSSALQGELHRHTTS